ncbi:MAG: hypothetical protein OMOMHJEC_03295 [Xanthomonadales bacterium]|nr:hypothetical protein [Xanthomonadales bacterium]
MVERSSLVARALATLGACLPAITHAGHQEISRSDSRLPSGHVFVDVNRSTRDQKVHVTISPPMGAWSQIIECPNNAKPLRVSYHGNIVFHLPGGKTYYETGDNMPSGNFASWGVFFGMSDWYATDLSGGGSFSLICPYREGVRNTTFTTIRKYNVDGTLPVPTCTTAGNTATCTVLSGRLWNELNERNWNVGPTLESHWRAVTRYNEKVNSRLAKERDAERAKSFREARPTIFAIFGLIVGALLLLVLVGHVKRAISRN